MSKIEKLQCSNCIFWGEAGDHAGNEAFRTGRCHRFPPSSGRWAVTNPADWCGEHMAVDSKPIEVFAGEEEEIVGESFN